MFLSTNSLSIVYTFSWEYISISSYIVVCPLLNITSVHLPERNRKFLSLIYISTENSCGVVANVMDRVIGVSVFELNLYYYVHFWTNRKGVNHFASS